MSGGALKAAIAVALALAALALAACGGGDGGAEAETQAVDRPSAEPPDFHLTEYDVNTTWEQESADKRVGDYLESVWRDPAAPTYKVIIDSRPAEGAPPPMAAAELSRLQAKWLSDYRERSLKRVKLGRRPAVRFAFFAAGRDWIEYYLEECGVSIVFRGSTAPAAYEPFSEFYGVVASRIKPLCGE